MADHNRVLELSVAGIGASAGGVAALKQVVPILPSGKGIAYVVMLHMNPTQQSLIVEILDRETALPVKWLEVGEKLLPERIYVVPPGHNCGAQDGQLCLLDAAQTHPSRSPPHSVDVLFSALAEAYGKHCAGIILSGSGSDGVHGMMAIKKAGGITIAQDPKTTGYAGMPQSVIDAGLADLILSPAGIGSALQDKIFDLSLEQSVMIKPTRALDDLLAVLSQKSKFEFSQYKESSLTRRIGRRMAVHGLQSLEAYTALVGKSDTEADLLSKDIFISVTAFFRDDDSFKALRQAIREILGCKPQGEALRIWVAGCATGEEAYSIAMLVDSEFGRKPQPMPVQIFATDIDTRAIASARRGLYFESSIKSLPAEVVKKYFVNRGGIYQIADKIREMVTFAHHDLARDPPYVKLDLVSCRNVLIYFKRPLQEKLIPFFNYSLRPGGYLALGQSESVGKFTNLFAPTDRKGKVFSKICEVQNLPELARARHFLPSRAEPRQMPRDNARSFHAQYRDMVTESYAPSGVLVNNRFEIVHIQGEVTQFLHLPAGDLNVNIMDMVIAPLRVETLLILQKAKREQVVTRSRPLELKIGDSVSRVTLIAIPAEAEPNGDRYMLLLFEVRPLAGPIEAEAHPDADFDETRTVMGLQEELIATRGQLQTSVEELQASYEDLQSVSEEYQTTAEELQTSNEELQSSNEEMLSLNDELKIKSGGLKSANADLENILNTVLSGILVLDQDCRVVRYSESSKQVFNLLPSCIGSSLYVTDSPFDLTLLSNEIERATKSGIVVDKDLTLDGKIFAVRVIPLFENGAMPTGSVITFSDETQRRQIEMDVRRLATVIEDSNDAVAVVGLDRKIVTWNKGAERMFGYSKAEALKLTLSDLALPPGRKLMEKAVRQLTAGGKVVSFELEQMGKEGQKLETWFTATLLRNEDGSANAIAVTVRDLTELKHLVIEQEVARRADRDKSDFLARVSHELRTPLSAILGFSEIIMNELFGPIEQRKYVEYGTDIHNSGMYLLNLVNDILDLSKIEKRDVQLKDEFLDLSELAGEALHMLNLEAEKQGVLLLLELAPDLPKLSCDHRIILQILINLLSNAVKYTPSGGRVCLEMHLDDDGALIIAVRDTGIGIDNADISMALEPFVQLSGRPGAKQLGYGLGLTITKSLTELLGANLEIASEIGKGTTVSVRFDPERLALASAIQ